MRLVWSRRDTAALLAAMARHPAYMGQQHANEAAINPAMDRVDAHLDQQERAVPAPVVDINTRERIR